MSLLHLISGETLPSTKFLNSARVYLFFKFVAPHHLAGFRLFRLLKPQGRYNPCYSLRNPLAKANTLYLVVIVVVNTKYSINRSF